MIVVAGVTFEARFDGKIVVKQYSDSRGGGNVTFEKAFTQEELETALREMARELDVLEHVRELGEELLPAHAGVDEARGLLNRRALAAAAQEEAELRTIEDDLDEPPGPSGAVSCTFTAGQAAAGIHPDPEFINASKPAPAAAIAPAEASEAPAVIVPPVPAPAGETAPAEQPKPPEAPVPAPAGETAPAEQPKPPEVPNA
jgi:hypothetical protein